VVLRTILGNLPPALDDLSPDWHGVVADLQQMSDEALWAVTKEQLPPPQWRRHQRLLRKGQEGTLSTAERQELAELRAAADRFVTPSFVCPGTVEVARASHSYRDVIHALAPSHFGRRTPTDNGT
jgi:hypothetical protein